MGRTTLFAFVLCSLAAGAEKESVRFVVLGDRTSNTVEGVFADIIDEISLLHPDFVINVGNLIEASNDDSTLIQRQWAEVLNTINILPCDFYFVPGSNDINSDLTRSIFEGVTGFKRYYSFDRGNSHFVVLDNSITTWTPLNDADPEQFAWLLEDLDKHKDAGHTFIFLNVPFYLNTMGANTPAPFMDACTRFRVRAVFSGSLHSYLYLNEDGTDYIVMGSSGAETEDLDPAKGNFYHCLYATVRDEIFDAAVIRKGNIFLRNIVTGSDYYEIQRAQGEVVSFPDLYWREDSPGRSAKGRFRVNNTGTDSINSQLVWHFDTLRHVISPSGVFVALAPGERGEYDFELKIKDNSKIFPLPSFALAFPFTYGKVCTLKSSMGVRRIKDVKKFKTPPVIDGMIEEDVWRGTKPIVELTGSAGEQSPVEACDIYLGYDKEYVYIAARCMESDLGALSIQATEHDGPAYADDNLWFFIDSNMDERTYYQLIVNPNGIVFDRSCSIEDGRPQTDVEWNGPWEVSSGREPGAWIIEMRIPKNGLAPFDEKKWGFNLRRFQTRVAEAGVWSLPFGHNPSSFGIIEFD